jgi:hypothetical protein
MLLIGGLAGHALALDPTQPIDSYLQTHFSKLDGLPSPVVNVILQTRNAFCGSGLDLGSRALTGGISLPSSFRRKCNSRRSGREAEFAQGFAALFSIGAVSRQPEWWDMLLQLVAGR